MPKCHAGCSGGGAMGPTEAPPVPFAGHREPRGSDPARRRRPGRKGRAMTLASMRRQLTVGRVVIALALTPGCGGKSGLVTSSAADAAADGAFGDVAVSASGSSGSATSSSGGGSSGSGSSGSGSSSSGIGSDASSGGSGSGSSEDASSGPDGDSGGCVDIDLSSYDTSCQTDSDCIDVNAGTFCAGYTCACGGSTINIDGEARYNAAFYSIPAAPGCSCPYLGNPRCVQARCVFCPAPGLATTGPPGCTDGSDSGNPNDGSSSGVSSGGSGSSGGGSNGDASSDDSGGGSLDDASSGGSSSGGSSSGGATSGACGTTGQACCPGEQCVDTELWCVGGICAACGSTGQPCCGTACNAGISCIAVGAASECEACGQPGQPCCTTQPSCINAGDGYGCWPNVWHGLDYCLNTNASTTGQPGEPCTTTCVDPTYACASAVDSPNCLACGGLAEPCCGTTCGAGLSCTAGTCQ